jgi:signal transduction histidine kinase
MAVLGYNDLLIRSGELTPMQQEFTRRIHSSGLQMRDLVLNLLEISRIEMGTTMKQEELDLHALLSESIAELEDQAQAKGHVLITQFCDERLRVLGDKLLLQQMVRNLLGNAIKYTPKDGHITTSTIVNDGHVLVSFQDNGIGIPAEDLPFIFNKFFRSHSDATVDIEGNGLGLAIVKSIAENHGGQVTVESAVGQGSTFTVKLPVVANA